MHILAPVIMQMGGPRQPPFPHRGGDDCEKRRRWRNGETRWKLRGRVAGEGRRRTLRTEQWTVGHRAKRLPCIRFDSRGGAGLLHRDRQGTRQGSVEREEPCTAAGCMLAPQNGVGASRGQPVMDTYSAPALAKCGFEFMVASV